MLTVLNGFAKNGNQRKGAMSQGRKELNGIALRLGASVS